jgi:hypothetical protein
MANAVGARRTLIGAHGCEQPRLRQGCSLATRRKEGGGTATAT